MKKLYVTPEVNLKAYSNDVIMVSLGNGDFGEAFDWYSGAGKGGAQ